MIIVALLFLVFTAPIWVIPLTWWSLEYGLAAVMVLLPSYLLRTTAWNIPTTTLELTIYGFLVGATLRWLIRGGFTWPRLPRRAWYLLGAWILAWTLSTIFSADQRASLGAVKAWLLDPLLIVGASYVIVRTTAQLRVLLNALATSGTVVAAVGLLQLASFRDTLQDGRLSSFFSPVANYAAMFLVPIVLITIGAVLWYKVSRAWWLGILIMLAATALTVSFGGYLALGVGLFVLWLSWPDRRQRGLAMMLAAITLLIGLGILWRTPYLAEKFNTTDRSSSLVRTQIWRTSIEMIKDHPIVGIGPNAYEPVYRKTIPHLYYPPLEWLVSQPHQLYLALWLETGALGFTVFIIGIGWWFRTLWPRFRRRDPLVLMSYAALLATLVHGFVDTPIFKNDLVLIFAFVLALPFLDRTLREKQN